jgi:hypothetical protein
MDHTTKRPMPTRIVSIEEIDEALKHTAQAQDRNEHWQRWLDALLDERNRIAAQTTQD